MREFPRREIFQLSIAAHNAGLKDVQREWPASGLWDPAGGRWHWFDIAGTINDLFIIIDFEPGYWDSRPTKPELQRLRQKQEWAARNQIPLLIMDHGHTTLEMTILIKQFLMEIKHGHP
jgi:hypothetical protein